MLWKIVGAGIAIAVGVWGVHRYMLKHQHVDTCPTAELVRQVVGDLDTNKISITAAQLRADAWEHDGCQIAADSVRAMIKVRQSREALASAADAAAAAAASTATPIPSATGPAFKTTGTNRERVLARR
jgi:hypothetical protein